MWKSSQFVYAVDVGIISRVSEDCLVDRIGLGLFTKIRCCSYRKMGACWKRFLLETTIFRSGSMLIFGGVQLIQAYPIPLGQLALINSLRVSMIPLHEG